MSTAPITQQQALKIVERLIKLGQRLESANNPDWFIVASAAATLEALRLGLITIEPAPTHWIGVDRGIPGTDQTVIFKGKNNAH